MMHFSPEAAPKHSAARRRAKGLAVRLGGALTCAALATSAWAQDGVGLQGLLPAEAPESILNSLGTLPESWATWSESVVTELTKFYSEPAADVAGQRAALDRLKVKLGTIDKALADGQYASIRGQLRGLRGALNRRIEIMEAVLDTVTAAATKMEEVRTHLKALLEGLEQYEATGSNAAATQVRAAFEGLRGQMTDGGIRLTDTLRSHYFNSNLQLAISEGFLNRVLAKTHFEEGGVRDFILGAEVYGCQITNTTTSFDLLPAENGAHLRLHLNGTVTTNTEGYKGHVVIFSNGNHTFTAYKDVHFDGVNDKFSTTPANMHVNASNEPVDASTKLDGIPILGGVGRSLAMSGAIRKRPEAEAIAAQRVTSRVGPEFDNEVDDKFTELNGKLQDKVIEPLKSENLYPDYKYYRSTDTELNLNSRVMATNELGGGTAPADAVSHGEMLLRLHESLINNFLDRLGVGGKTMTEQELRKLLEEKLSKLLNKDVDIPDAKESTGDDKQPKAFIFTAKDPLRVKAADGKILLVIRAGFQRDEDKGGNIPPQIVTIPLTMTIEGDQIVVSRGEVTVDPVDMPDNVAEQLARAGVIKKKIETSMQDKRDTRTLKVEKDDGEKMDVNVTEIEALDGWISLRLQ